MIHVGIVGYGFAGRSFHAYLVSLAKGLRLTAVATRDPERRATAAREWSIDTYETLTEMTQDDRIQLIILATPHHAHAAMAIEAMEAGKHVVVDKVMCMHAAQAKKMIAVSKRKKVMLSVFHNRRWDGGYLTVKKAIEGGLLGEPFFIETTVHRYRASRGWRANKADSGGLLYDWGAHLIDQAVQLIPGRPRSVFCRGQKHIWPGDIEDHVTCTIQFMNGVEYNVEVSNIAHIKKPHWYVLGTKGALIKEGLDPQEKWMIQGNIEGAQEDPAHRARMVTELNGLHTEMIIDSVPGSWKSYYQNIADVLNDGKELAVKPEEVHTVMQILDAAKDSQETGEVVTI